MTHIALIFLTFTLRNGTVVHNSWMHPALFGDMQSCSLAGEGYLAQTKERVQFVCVDTLLSKIR